MRLEHNLPPGEDGRDICAVNAAVQLFNHFKSSTVVGDYFNTIKKTFDFKLVNRKLVNTLDTDLRDISQENLLVINLFVKQVKFVNN